MPPLPTKEVGGEKASLTLSMTPTQGSLTHEDALSPIVANVDGDVILLEEYEKQLLRYEAGLEVLGWNPTTQGDYQITVLEQMINELLIVHAAQARGYVLADVQIQAAFDESEESRGGSSAFDEWLDLNLYTRDEFRVELRDQILASMVQAEVVAGVSKRAEQVRARHVLVGTLEEAQALLAQLESGAKLATLAIEHSLDQSTRINGGDLGWFPKGFLTVPELERAAFTQDLGEPSGIIRTFLGFHLVETLERDPDRILSPEAYLQLQQVAVESWLAGLHDNAHIERYVP